MYIVYVVFYQVELIWVCPYFKGDSARFRQKSRSLSLFVREEGTCLYVGPTLGNVGYTTGSGASSGVEFGSGPVIESNS